MVIPAIGAVVVCVFWIGAPLGMVLKTQRRFRLLITLLYFIFNLDIRGWVGPCTKTVFSGWGGVRGRGLGSVIFDILLTYQASLPNLLYSSVQFYKKAGAGAGQRLGPVVAAVAGPSLLAGCGRQSCWRRSWA